MSFHIQPRPVSVHLLFYCWSFPSRRLVCAGTNTGSGEWCLQAPRFSRLFRSCNSWCVLTLWLNSDSLHQPILRSSFSVAAAPQLKFFISQGAKHKMVNHFSVFTLQFLTERITLKLWSTLCCSLCLAPQFLRVQFWILWGPGALVDLAPPQPCEGQVLRSWKILIFPDLKIILLTSWESTKHPFLSLITQLWRF